LGNYHEEFDQKPYLSVDGMKTVNTSCRRKAPRRADLDAANLMDTIFMRKL